MWVSKLVEVIISNWREILIVLSGAVIYILLDKLAIAKLKRDERRVKLELQNAAVLNNAVDVEEKEKIVIKYVNKVHTEYRDRVKVIYELGDKNETCEQFMSNVDSYKF